MNGEAYFESWLKPILLLIEYNHTDDIDANFISIDSNLQPEHILPQNFINVSGWSHFTEAIGEQHLNTIGNMTLLSGKKNKGARDYPIDEKIKIYSGVGKNSNKSDGITSFIISQRIVNDYNAAKFGKKWNEESIIDRHNWLCEEIGNILDIDTLSIRL